MFKAQGYLPSRRRSSSTVANIIRDTDDRTHGLRQSLTNALALPHRRRMHASKTGRASALRCTSSSSVRNGCRRPAAAGSVMLLLLSLSLSLSLVVVLAGS